MANLPRYMRACLQTGKLASLAILVSGGIVLQVLACALYDNWWPMLTVLMYVLLPMPLLFFGGSDSSSLFSESGNSWMDATKFLTGASAMGSIAIPVILKHAGVIGWGALTMELSSFFVFVLAILCYIRMDDDNDGYSIFWDKPKNLCFMCVKIVLPVNPFEYTVDLVVSIISHFYGCTCTKKLHLSSPFPLIV